ncbi:CRISPR-associated protein Cas5 [Anaerosporobacter sp.]|uniref:CRISPR-associated protein Cas5 n=1 Tax=Anaerosporobacter sp. TaxID=1872529 RepID=UPI00286EE68D|nr:CRISPR-associated protein Cas5 [Anaerosporobacter sp.]
MEALRIHLTQTSANYRREETINNKMTYPLPPFSTVIGALHNICNFKEYHPMDISIQGDYKSLNKEAYTDYCFLNTTQDDRGILVKMANPSMLSTGYSVVAHAIKSQGNSFRNGITISVEDKELLQEFRDLKDLNDKIAELKKGRFTKCMNLLKKRKKSLANKKKSFDKKSDMYLTVEAREKELKQIEKDLEQRFRDYEEEHYSKPISKFRTLTKSLKCYEVLTDIELIIHVKSNHETLQKIKENIYEWKSLGRSEDFVEIKEAEFVNLEVPDKLYESTYHAYIDAEIADETDDSNVVFAKNKGVTKIHGVKYYINKVYRLEEGKRFFEKKKVYYTSKYMVDEESLGVYIDKSKENPLIVNFV